MRLYHWFTQPFPSASLLLVLLLSGSAWAHHGTSISYDQTSWITVEGRVTEFRYRNPHSVLILDIQGGDGQTAEYAIELASPIAMARGLRWTRDTFNVGDQVVFRVHPSRTGANVGECLSDCEVTINGVPPAVADLD